MTSTLPAPAPALIPFVIVNVGDTFEYGGRTGVVLKVNPSKYVVRMDDDQQTYNLGRAAKLNITGSKSITDLATKPDFYPTQRVRITEGKSKDMEFIITKVDVINATYSGKSIDGIYNVRGVPFAVVVAA